MVLDGLDRVARQEAVSPLGRRDERAAEWVDATLRAFFLHPRRVDVRAHAEVHVFLPRAKDDRTKVTENVLTMMPGRLSEDSQKLSARRRRVEVEISGSLLCDEGVLQLHVLAARNCKDRGGAAEVEAVVKGDRRDLERSDERADVLHDVEVVEFELSSDRSELKA